MCSRPLHTSILNPARKSFNEYSKDFSTIVSLWSGESTCGNRRKSCVSCKNISSVIMVALSDAILLEFSTVRASCSNSTIRCDRRSINVPVSKLITFSALYGPRLSRSILRCAKSAPSLVNGVVQSVTIISVPAKIVKRLIKGVLARVSSSSSGRDFRAERLLASIPCREQSLDPG
jgi:hypothetical protein